MNYEIIQINQNSWRIEDNGVRFFLLTGQERALLIDSGRNIPNTREIAESITDLPITLVNTHADGDHIAGNDQFDTIYLHPAEEGNYRKNGVTGSFLPVNEGDEFDLGGRKLEVIHLPGHTPGSIALLDHEQRVLISGDPIQDGRIYMFGFFRHLPNYVKSLEHLSKWMGQFDEIWPSHASFPVSPELIGRLHNGAISILEGEVSGQPEEVNGKKIIAYNLGFATFLCNS